MSRPLIGQVLSRMGKLSAIDVDEILVEQAVTHRRFGEIALAWGLCGPEHLCEAWCDQFQEDSQRIDLPCMEVDERAARCLNGDLARRLIAIPLRIMGNQLVVAVGRLPAPEDAAEIIGRTGLEVRFIEADPRRIQCAIDCFYPLADPPKADSRGGASTM